MTIQQKIFILFISVFVSASALAADDAIKISTATGQKINFDNKTGIVEIKGNAVVENSTATLKAEYLSVDINNKIGYGEGNVEVTSETGNLTGSHATYYWEASTGVITNAQGLSPPWYFEGEQLEIQSTDLYKLKKVLLTSCDHDPPHYALLSSRGKIQPGKRANLSNARLHIGTLPSFWSPFITKSLVQSKLRVRIEPGHTSRDGLITKTTIGYPLTYHSYATVRWNWLQRTGNGVGVRYDYNMEKPRGVFDWYWVRDHNEDPQPQGREYTVLWNHFQKITDRFSGNAKVDFKSKSTFGREFSNEGNGIIIEDTIRGLLSEAGLSYRFDKATLQTDFNRKDKFDSRISSDSFISELLLPRINFNTTKLNFGHLPFYTQFNASWVNQTRVRDDPEKNLKYIRSATGGFLVDKTVRVQKIKATFSPSAGFNHAWNSDISTSSSHDVYFSRYNYGLNWRQKLTRDMETNVGYNTILRSKQDRLGQDVNADDRGVEQNLFNGRITSRWNRDNLIELASGIDVRAAPRNNQLQYQHSTARITPPTLYLAIKLSRNVALTFRETYSIFNAAEQRIVRTPLNTSGDLQIGEVSKKVFFSQGFSYAKSASGQRAELLLNNKAKFFLTPSWYVDFTVNYLAAGENKLNYSKFEPIQKTLTMVRDLHCWVFRMEFLDRADRREASFYIDLKANLSKSNNVFQGSNDQNRTVYRDYRTDVDEIFPYNGQEKVHQKEND